MGKDLGASANSAKGTGDTAILVLSCDSYADVWPVFFTLFFRYWPRCPFPVYLGANHLHHQDERVTTLRVGDDMSWSQSAQLMLSDLRTTYVLTFLEDYLITAPVDGALVEALVNEMHETGAEFIRFRRSPHAKVPAAGHPLLGELPPGVPYRVSLDIGLWRRETLLSLLRDGETAWDMEIAGSRRSDALPGFFCSAVNVFSRTNGLERGKWKRYNLPMLRREHIALPQGHEVMSVQESLRAWAGRCYWRARAKSLRQRTGKRSWYVRGRRLVPRQGVCASAPTRNPQAMLQWLDSTYGLLVRGVLHVGANLGQEAAAYHDWGMRRVWWIEADPVVFAKLERNIADYPEQKAILACVSEEDGASVRFNLASNDGASSSALAPDVERCRHEWPGVKFVGSVELPGVRLDTLVNDGTLPLADCDLLVLDLQGSELVALRSLGPQLPTFKAVLTEVNLKRMYHGVALLHEVDFFFQRHGFRRVVLTLGTVQGEALYVRGKRSTMGGLWDLVLDLAAEAISGSGLLSAVQNTSSIAAVLRPLWRALSGRGAGGTQR